MTRAEAAITLLRNREVTDGLLLLSYVVWPTERLERTAEPMSSDELAGACAELHAQGLSHYEIARRLKRRRSTVQSALRRAR